MKSLLLASLFSLLVFLQASSVSAEIYKYKDKHGRWQFSDKPIGEAAGKSSIKGSATKKVSKNLGEQLKQKFNPQSDIDKASLAVVKIKTRTGSGSGFFISDTGYLITNRHVVRPATSSSWEDNKEKLEEIKVDLDQRWDHLKDQKERLRDWKESLDESKDYIESSRSSDSERKRYARSYSRYKKDEETLDKRERKLKKLEKDYNRKKSEFGWQQSMTNFSKSFEITLKNKKKLKAKLIKISENHDLALLKLNNFETPYIKVERNRTARQGEKVFAIGSPLGYSDSLTSGIITNQMAEYLMTDTTILPGNSGGPLLNSKGQLVGVNTAVVSQEKHAEGLGLAIYSKYIYQEFSDVLL